MGLRQAAGLRMLLRACVHAARAVAQLAKARHRAGRVSAAWGWGCWALAPRGPAPGTLAAAAAAAVAAAAVAAHQWLVTALAAPGSAPACPHRQSNLH